MKKLLPIMSLILIAAFTLSACAQQPATVDPVPEKPATMQTEIKEIEPVQSESTQIDSMEVATLDPVTDDVEALVLEKISGQHTMSFILTEKRSAEEWSEVIDRMIGYGAKINEQEKSLIIEWLLEQQQ